METSTSLDKNLGHTTSAFYRVINKIATQETAFTGMSPSYAYLIVIVKERPGIRLTELSEKLLLEISSVSRLIEKLEVKNYMIRDSSPGITKVYLTDLGNQVYENFTIGLSRSVDKLKESLGKKAYKELNRSLKSAIDVLINATPE